MDIKYALFVTMLLLAGLTVGSAALAEESSEPPSNTPATSKKIPVDHMPPGVFTEEGADTCIKCHDEDSEFPVFDIFKTKHGQKGDKRSPFASLQCEGCHGPGVAGLEAMEEALARGGHVGRVRPGQERPPILNFGDKSDEPVQTQNQMCFNCHQDVSHIGWEGSVHGGNEVACANCHTIHAPQDLVTAKATQSQVCYKCHTKQRAEFYKPSTHPVRFGQMTCTECHSPHGTVTAGLLKEPTLNQTCFKCHAEKRGPYLWEHAPVAEDCSTCHTPHGSIHPSLLAKRAPLLCQQCHSQANHPSLARTTDELPGGSPSKYLLSGACLNCHSQVHGSNHPSGVKLMR